MVRSMLSDSELPQRFWAEALSTAMYLRNRSPTKAVVEATPYEVWTGEKPTFSHIHRFGCTAYCHVAKDERQKLDFKANRCIFLGYGTDVKGFRVYDYSKSKVLHNRDVIFNEEENGIEKEQIDVSKSNQNHPLINGEWSIDVSDSVEETAEKEQPIEENHHEVQTDDNSTVQLQRSTRVRKPPDYYGVYINTANSEQTKVPTTVNEALAGDEKEKWKSAMNEELESMERNDVWDLVTLPQGRKPVGSKWVFKRKLNGFGAVERYKARIVAQGYSQCYGLDYDETFSPVVRFESIRMLIALAVQYGLKVHQMDVTAAFLNGDLAEDVYMTQPEGYAVKGQEHLVCKLKRSLHGLKQSPRCWNSTLDARLKELGFIQTDSDPCIYRASKGEMFLIAVYVDDIILATKSDSRLEEVKKKLDEHFEIKDMGQLHYFLGVNVIHEHNSIWIGQPTYANSLLQ